MAAYRLQSSYDTVQVFSSSEVVDAIFCTITTNGHGAVVNRPQKFVRLPCRCQGARFCLSIADDAGDN